jgi:hypothetical protein
MIGDPLARIACAKLGKLSLEGAIPRFDQEGRHTPFLDELAAR